MQYISTRGRTRPVGFQDAVIEGLAPDGGLLIPSVIPDARDRLAHWTTLSYQDITFEILRLFVDLPDDDLRELIRKSYEPFRHPEIAPAVPVGDIQVLELFHGPTLAFKDIALQFLSNFYDYILARKDRCLNILGATSGDTGSAAIHGIRGKARMNIFIMHPRGRVAPLQERQMTTVLDANVFNLAVEGTFDDCQRIMKSIFSDVGFKEKYALGSVNSVNWARVLAQIVYYFSAGLYVLDQSRAKRVRFSVPTGNFGDILAGWYAWRMGLPVGKLILATNENDILARFFESGEYCASDVVPTISPSMDIQVASNFERYLYYRVGEDPGRLTALMDGFKRAGSLRLDLKPGERVDGIFEAGVGTTDRTLATIRRYHEKHGYLLDPHTAVGVSVGEEHGADGEPLICLATAHPAKFPQAIKRATGRDIARHPVIDSMEGAKTRMEVLPADEGAVREYLAAHSVN